MKKLADEQKQEGQEQENTVSFKTADELTKFLMDLQAQVANMQQIIDKLSPVDENGENDSEASAEGDSEGDSDKEMSDDEINEIDKLLQAE